MTTIRGTANDNWEVTGVWHQLNNGAWSKAVTTNAWTNWTTTVGLVAGTNTIRAYAVDSSGNRSATGSVNVVSTEAFELRLEFNTIRPLASNGLSFVLHVTPGLSGHIQVSTNLADWGSLIDFAGTNDTLQFGSIHANESLSSTTEAVCHWPLMWYVL